MAECARTSARSCGQGLIDGPGDYFNTFDPLAAERLRGHRCLVHGLHRLHAGDAVSSSVHRTTRGHRRRGDRDVDRAQPRHHAGADGIARSGLGAPRRSFWPQDHGRAIAGELCRPVHRDGIREERLAGAGRARHSGTVRGLRFVVGGHGCRIGPAREDAVRDRRRANRPANRTGSRSGDRRSARQPRRAPAGVYRHGAFLPGRAGDGPRDV